MYLLGRWDFLRTEWYIAIGHDIVDHSLACFCTYPPFCKWTRQQNVPKMQLSFKVVNSIAVHEKKAGLIPTNMVDALDNICRKLDIRVFNTTKNLSCKKSKFLQTSYARICMMLFLIFKRILKYSNKSHYIPMHISTSRHWNQRILRWHCCHILSDITNQTRMLHISPKYIHFKA